MYRRVMCMIFVLLLSASAAGCGRTAEKTTTETAVETAEMAPETDDGTETEDVRGGVSDGLPEKDYEGYTFTFYLRDTHYSDFVAEEASAEIVAEAVYMRNLTVCERFNVEFAYNYDESGNTTYNTTAAISIEAGEDANDILAEHGAYIFQHTKKGYLLDWIDNMPWCDLEAPWWDKDFTDNMTIAGKLFGMTGDISYKSIGSSYCFLVNRDMLKILGLPLPYDDVRAGTWTFDQFLSMAETAIADLDGDGVITEGKDRFAMYGESSWSFPVASFYMDGSAVISVDTDGVPQLTLYNERNQEILERTTAFCRQPGVYIPDLRPKIDGDLFRNGQALFASAKVMHLERYRDLEADIGILPYPKYEESASRYYCLVDAGENVFGIPVTASDTERTSVIVEAMAAEGYRSVVPVYYEQALKTKYSRDSDSADILEIIRDSRYFDYGYYDNTIDRFLSYIGRFLMLEDAGLASYYKSKENGALQALEEVYRIYQEVE